MLFCKNISFVPLLSSILLAKVANAFTGIGELCRLLLGILVMLTSGPIATFYDVQANGVRNAIFLVTRFDLTHSQLPGSCGVFKQNSDFVVALSIAEANNNAHCGQNIIVNCKPNFILHKLRQKES